MRSLQLTAMPRYTPACNKLLAQYKTALGLVQPHHITDIYEFMEQYQV